MIDQNIFKKGEEFLGTKGMIYFGDKILVFRRDEKTNKFPLMIDLPGGGREVDESPFECFKREILEEFGININIEDVIFSKPFPSLFNENKVMYFFVVKKDNLKEEDIKFGDEGLYYQLMTPQEFVELKDGVERQQEKVRYYLELIK